MTDIDIMGVVVYAFLFLSLFFEVILLITYFERRDSCYEEKYPLRTFPSVTIIVPCFNEALTITATLRSLLALRYPKKKLSIIVVNDGSTDNTQEVLELFKNHPQIQIYTKENGGKHTALNFGLARAKSDLIGCLDADSIVDRFALERIVRHFEKHTEIMAVTPAVHVLNPKNLIELVQQAEYTLGIFLRKIFSFLGAIYITPGPFSIFRKEVFERIGEYTHAHNTEDLEIALRMQAHRLKIENAHDAHVYTVAPRTFKALYRQRLRWTYGFLRNAHDYRHLFFRARYAHLGWFVLPMALVSLVSAVCLFGIFLVKTATSAYDAIVKLHLVGFNFAPHSFDWFFIRANASLFITLAVVAGTIFILILSKRITEEKIGWPVDITLFLLCYGFMAPLWISSAMANALFSKRIAWR